MALIKLATARNLNAAYELVTKWSGNSINSFGGMTTQVLHVQWN